MPEDQPKSVRPAPGTPPERSRLTPAFERFVEIVARLRAPDGCPWDRQQTLATIKPYTLEETYELLEAIDSDDDPAITEELGDLLLQVVLDAQIAADEGRFTLIEVIEGIAQKMIDRHPHVFGSVEAKTAADVTVHWEHAKQREKQRESALDGIPADLPQLARAARIAKKAARVGYDFPNRDMLFAKLREEVDELAEELYPDGTIPDVPADVDLPVAPDEPIGDAARQERVAQEIGDILFVVANIARRWNVNPEEALRHSNRKFARRFRYIEQRLKEQGRDAASASLREMEDLYQEGKRREP